MKQNGLMALCLVMSLGMAIMLSGCGSDKPGTEGSDSSQTGVIDPALAPQGNGDSDSSDSKEPGQNEQGDAGGNDAVTAIQTDNSLANTIKAEGDKQVVTNSESNYVVVNKERYLPEGYVPSDLVEPQVKFSFDGPHEKRQMRQEAASALEELFAKADEDGMTLNAVSGYRSEKRQTSLYNNYVETQGEEYANRVSAKPGTSEHQTGLTIDVSSPSVSNELEQVFGDSAEGKWLAGHAHEYGFIIRYPQNGEEITGYMYEPWHIRYVGKEVAAAIYEQDTTLEQFFGL